MATVSGSGRPTDARSGGKIVTKRRRKVTTTTPYDRPPQPPPQQPQPQPQESPNWLTSVIFPATRMIASGAAKILSSVFDSSSSSSSSSSDSDAASDNDVNHSNKDHSISSEAMKCVDKEPQLSLRNSVTKSAIERLLMQERFSREERDILVQVIDSRVMDPTAGGEEDGLLADMPVGTVGYDTADLCSKAVMEARKWLSEKKVGLSSLSDFAQESHGLNYFELQYIENEDGSPVDVAKLYMRSRPPWASPLAEHIELRTPSAMARELFREGTPASFRDGFLSSSKKRNFASASWNIEEEIRRVRLKASKDMLSSLPPSKIDPSSLATTLKPRQDFLIADLSTSRGDIGNKLNVMTGTPSVDASMNTTARLNTSVGISVMETGQDGLENETLTSHPATILSEEYQDSEAVNITAEFTGSRSNHLTSEDLDIEFCNDPRSGQKKVSPAEEVRKFDEIGNVNGLHTSQERQPHDGNSNADKSYVKTTNSIPLEDVCEFLSEASVEIPIVDETNDFVNVSQTYEELSPVPTQPYTSNLAGKVDDEVVKQDAKKPGRYSRRGRGRGK